MAYFRTHGPARPTAAVTMTQTKPMAKARRYLSMYRSSLREGDIPAV